ncbi:centrosomal protein of 170 kDa protein B isoform X3 [Brachyhypopomus gauderio]|uniref:centrosomal protein of 170 kDa protein B isoform X3 n=1 Tax=Brachyhypopomus gauderio TaxID=698409 RepID=UPI0040434663
MSVTSWFLVSSSGTRHRLPREMIFVGREDCELMLQSRSVDKQHAVINFNPATDEHLLKDLGSLNGTFVNDLRIPDQTYITLKVSDSIRFGYDSHVYILERSQHKVPEEALKHEKYTSQLHIGSKASEEKRQDLQEERSKLERFERKGLTEAPIPRPTPLYGQPSWWGEEDLGSKGPHSEACKIDNKHSEFQEEDPEAEVEVNGSLQDFRDSQSKSAFLYHREPSYFEIPTKEFPTHPVIPAVELNDIPTKDTSAPLTPTPTIVQSHASFTIEFDECTPGKIKIKDHVTKFSSHQRSKQQNRKSLATAPVDVLSAKSKVADWLVQSDVGMMHRRPPCEDVCSTKSDLAMHIRTLKGHHHEDGTQSDSEDPVIKEKRSNSHCSVQLHQSTISKITEPSDSLPLQQSSNESFQPEPLLQCTQVQDFCMHPEKRDVMHMEETNSLSECQVKSGHRETLSQQAFIIEFLDDNPRKKRSQSFTHNPAQAETYSALKAKLERRKGGTHAERPASVHGHIPPTQQITVPLKGSNHSGLQRSSSLKREKTDESVNRSSTSPSSSGPSSRSSPAVTIKPFGSIGKKSKLAQDFPAELHKDSEQISPSPMSAPPVMVFGVLDAPEYSGQTFVVYRPVINEQAIFSHAQSGSVNIPTADLGGNLSGDLAGLVQRHGDQAGQPKWVSRWASLADTYSEADTTQAPSGTPTQGELAIRDGRVALMVSQSLENSESESSQSSRTKRLLPQVPPAGEKQEISTSNILIQHNPKLDNEQIERSSKTSQLLDASQRLQVQDDVDPDSLSDTSRSDDSSILDRSTRTQGHRRHTTPSPSENVPYSIGHKVPANTPKSTSFYIGSEDGPYKSDTSQSPAQSQSDRDPSLKTSPTTILIRHLSCHEPRRPVKPNSSAPNLQNQEIDAVIANESFLSSFVRQESFTKDRPSDNIQVKRLPHISSHPALRDLGTGGSDLNTFSDDRRNVVSQESKQSTSAQQCKNGGSPGQGDDSFSGESDVDTASSVSVVSSKNAPMNAPTKRTASNGLCKDKSASSQSAQPSARDRLSEKRRNHATAETTVSDHESSSRPANHKKITGTLQKEDIRKSNKAGHQVLTRSNSLSAPRPTRASMLRRARLGDASDNEGAETDRGSQSSEHTKIPGDVKKLSRLDILAMPRKRTGSFTAPSDNESTSGKPGTPSRAAETSISGRKLSSGEAKQTTIKGASAVEKHSSTRIRTSQTKHNSTNSWRQKGFDYSSTSEEELETSSNSKNKRAHASASTQTQTPQKTTQTRLKPGALETEDDEAQNKHYQNWSTHSAEIARLSQDLAKDLAILAREIHDVAGDGDAQTSSVVVTTISPGSMPSTPASTISAREELVHHIPEASLNYQKVPPGSTSPVDSNMNDSKRRPWNREEVLLDNLMLNPVSQLSQAIRENTEQLAEKMKALFHNKTEVWEEIEAKLNAENEVPIIKTSNKEISSILQELRRVQRQLEVINTIVEPVATGSKLPSVPPVGKTKPRSKEFTCPTAQNSNASARRGFRGTERERHVV